MGRDERSGMDACTTDPDDEQIASLVVPRHLVKWVKTALEQRHKGSSRKIVKCSIAAGDPAEYDGKYMIASTFCIDDTGLEGFLHDEGFIGQVEICAKPRQALSVSQTRSPIECAMQEWFVAQKINEKCAVDSGLLLREVPKTYSTYGPLLLLPPAAFQSTPWQDTLEAISEDEYRALFRIISEWMKVSHVAINAPIPPQNAETENIVRTPTNLKPLFGDFGPVCTSALPCGTDFQSAFWCHTKQNGITQFWAPRYTMFSRGNITEKARVLKMPNVARAIKETPETGCCAVDLYAGIGYFTFSYLAAGVKKVLGWDLNPWSIEGLRRGALANKWGVEVYSSDTKTENLHFGPDTRLAAFVESNEHALARIDKLRASLPPIRHVNCGLLPTSRGSYGTAAAALDPRLGGWVHVHENFATAEIDEKSEEVRQEFERLTRELNGRVNSGVKSSSRLVKLEHTQKVKSYAPGVYHCVVDIFVGAASG